MKFPHRFGVMKYRHHATGIDQEPIQRVEAFTYEDAARRAVGEGLTIVADTKIRGLGYVAAKV
ncbi:MAG: hypothetical protein NTV97_05345 [Alphaproteobacteria bacterium]|nr:hypothetical protein [Alphaproteobacteria bacterium]